MAESLAARTGDDDDDFRLRFFDLVHEDARPLRAARPARHASIYSAAVFHDELGADFPETTTNIYGARLARVAVVWDEDHDVRILEVMERLYLCRWLPAVMALSERKGEVSVYLKPRLVAHPGVVHELAVWMERHGAYVAGDWWKTSVVPFVPRVDEAGVEGLSDDVIYLEGLRRTWRLDKMDIETPPQPIMALLPNRG